MVGLHHIFGMEKVKLDISNSMLIERDE